MPAATTSSPSDAEASSAIIGPTTLHHHMSAIVVDTGWTARRLNDGSVQLLAIRSKSTVNDSIPTTTDAAPTPARIELFHQRFAAIADQMGAALQRTAISTNVKERNDFSCALFDDNGRLIANAPHIPVHLGSMGACVRAVIETGHTLNPGDVICVNDPACGGTHLPDITVVTPVFANDALAFLVASRAHHAEIGGLRPGSMTPDATSLAQEGVLIKPFKLVDAGRERLTEMRDLLTNAPHPSRNPDENIADLIAQIAANRAGATALHTLINDFGTERLHRFTHLVRAAAETKMQSAIRNIPDGEYTCADQLDDGASVTVKVTIHDESAKVDFTGSAPVHPGALNATPAIVASAVLYCFRCLIHDHVPLNDGLLAPIEIIIPPGLLNPPAHDDPSQCPAVAGGNVETSQRVVDVVLTALGVAANSQGTMNNVIFGNDRVSFYETLCGGHGAGPNYHGADAVHTHMTNTRLTDPEVLEARYPVRLRQFAIRRGSGGTGQHVGGDGCVREIEFLEPVQLSLITQRRTRPPQGLEGGESGSPGVNRLWVASRHHWESLNPIDARDLQPGDQLRIETPGGGGFGPSASE
jgi:5-oxoprolinase (ATP-hydrolysing)